MAQSNQSPAGIDRKITIKRNTTSLHGFPTLTGFRQTGMIYRHVLGNGETVVSLKPVHLISGAKASAIECIGHGLCCVRKNEIIAT